MKKTLIIIVILFLCGLCAYGGYWYAKKKLTEEDRIAEIVQNTDPSTVDMAYTSIPENEQDIENEEEVERENIQTLGDLDAESIQKWKGEYYAEYFDEKSKKDNKPIEISVSISSPEDANIDIGRKGVEKSSVSVSSYFGTFEKINKENSSVLFIPQVKSGSFEDGSSGKMEDGFFITEKDGNFYVRTNYISKKGSFIEFPIKKLK